MKYPIDESLNPSYFKKKNSRKPEPMEWRTVLEIIQNDPQVRANTLASREARHLGDNDKADALKADCGAITAAACCEGGHGRKDISGLTGKLALDFDHIPVDRMAEAERMAKDDESTFLCYVTNSGNGLRIIVRYQPVDDEAQYADAFNMAARYFERKLRLEADRRTCDESRLSFLSHDPAAVLHPQAKPFRVYGQSLLEQARQDVEGRGMVFTVHHHNEYVWNVAVWLRDHGMTLQDAKRCTTAAFAADYPDTEQVVRSVYQNDPHAGSRTIRTASLPSAGSGNKAKATVTDIKAYLATATRLRRNAVTREIEIGTDDDEGWRLLSDTDVNSLWSHMSEEVCPARLEDIWAVIRSDATPDYDPFHSYIDALPAWNPDSDPDYIGQLAARIHTTADPQFFADCFRKWFVGILAALFSDATNQVILVFIGRQGIYKTTFFQRLLPPQWQKRYFFTKTNSQVFDKDDKIVMANHVLINLEEIDRMSPAELNQLKAFITEKDIHVRPPYGHAPEHYRHIASFCGTGNNLRFLTDTTGNRRWLPFEVTRIDSPFDNPLPYDNLYAQARYLWQSGFSYWFSQAEIDALAAHNLRFEAPNSEAELIDKYFRLPLPGETGIFLSATDIIDYLGTYTTIKSLTAIKAGKALAQLGFEKKYVNRRYAYCVVKRDLEEVRAENQQTGSENDVPF